MSERERRVIFPWLHGSSSVGGGAPDPIGPGRRLQQPQFPRQPEQLNKSGHSHQTQHTQQPFHSIERHLAFDDIASSSNCCTGSIVPSSTVLVHVAPRGKQQSNRAFDFDDNLSLARPPSFASLVRSNSLPSKKEGQSNNSIDVVDTSKIFLPLPQSGDPSRLARSSDLFQLPNAFGLRVRDSVWGRPSPKLSSYASDDPNQLIHTNQPNHNNQTNENIQPTQHKRNNKKKWIPIPTPVEATGTSSNTTSSTEKKSHSIFGEALQRRTYYPAASAPRYLSPPHAAHTAQAREPSQPDCEVNFGNCVAGNSAATANAINSETTTKGRKKPLPSILRKKYKRQLTPSPTNKSCATPPLSNAPSRLSPDPSSKSSNLCNSPSMQHPEKESESTPVSPERKSLCIPPEVPTLASPTSIRSLSCHSCDAECSECLRASLQLDVEEHIGIEGIGKTKNILAAEVANIPKITKIGKFVQQETDSVEDEVTSYNIKLVSDAPKILPRTNKATEEKNDKKLRRNSSDTIVAKCGEEQRQRRRRSAERISAANANVSSAAGTTLGSSTNNSNETAIGQYEDTGTRNTTALVSTNSTQPPQSDSIHSSTTVTTRDSSVSRHHSLECLSSNHNVSFDPHIWVYEYPLEEFEMTPGEKWFTEEELIEFKMDAIQRIRKRSIQPIGGASSTERIVEATNRGMERSNSFDIRLPLPTSSILPANVVTGTGSINSMAPNINERSKKGNANLNYARPFNFNHPALSCEDEFDADGSFSSITNRQGSFRNSPSRSPQNSVSSLRSNQDILVLQEIRNVLIVDKHDAFLRLFTKCLKHMMPHVAVATARTGEEAMARIHAAQRAYPPNDPMGGGGAVHGFDIVIVEERLGPMELYLSRRGGSGSDTFKLTEKMENEESLQAPGDDSAQRRRKLTSGSDLIGSIEEEEYFYWGGGSGGGGSIGGWRRGSWGSRDSRSGHSVGRRGSWGSGGSSECNRYTRFSLLIGVSAYLSEDKDALEKSGADMIWGKPPPDMNVELRDDILKFLMRKRNRG